MNLLQILLADDEEDDRFLFSDALNELKIETIVRTVNDGVELMTYLATEGIDFPQLIFLDLNMPRKNGKECLKEIRALYGNQFVIAIFSTSAAEKDIEETYLLGANVYINKPNTFEALKQSINKVVTNAVVYQDPPFNINNFILRI